MKKLMLLMTIISVNYAFAFELPIVKVKDGDTIATTIVGMPEGLQDFAVRIRGIDTPEKGGRAKCLKEDILGQDATRYTKLLAYHASTMEVTNCSHDKYGGRIVCNVSIAGSDVGSELIKKGYARPYDGGKKSSWCK